MWWIGNDPTSTPFCCSKILIIKNLSKPGERGITGKVFLMYY
jgi:hypothetical protein